jgi:DNA mismatch repair protein MutS
MVKYLEVINLNKLTPMMQQYERIKGIYPDAILFFRLGDFYEMFNEDAKIGASVLDLALTSRNKGGNDKAPMAGVPYHSAESYIAKLIDNGYKVAICEQLEDPSDSDGLVDRDVIRVISPGTIIENEMLNDKENNYLAACLTYNSKFGLSYVDISTGEFYASEFSPEFENKFWDEIDRIQPREIIIDDVIMNNENYKKLHYSSNFLENKIKLNSPEKAYKLLLNQFNKNSLLDFGCEGMESAILAAGEIINFLNITQKRALDHIDKILTYNINEYMILDATSRRNLEINSTIREKKKNGSLLNLLDKTITAMGGRLIKKWINQPLVNINEIIKRQDALEEIMNNYILLQELREDLEGIYDLERILSKISYGTANARDLLALKNSLNKFPELKTDISKLNNSLINEISLKFDDLSDIRKIIEDAIKDNPPTGLRDGGLIKDAYSLELDNIRSISSKGKAWIANLQSSERKRTGINSLKVGFNKVFGYYLEVTNANLDRVPEDYNRKQTLSNSERYITPELKEKEALVLGAEEKINNLEYELFVNIRDKIGENLKRIKDSALYIAKIDALLSLSIVGLENNYIRPEIHEDGEIRIINGRHPVVEDILNGNFVPNDTYLNRNDNRFLIITGPNMSGKSTYMRQVALIVLLAQIGSFVPADRAKITIVDRIFTRVGASDDLTGGQSTFMVEMTELANILNNASRNSLIILDEVGRGTSTYDGLSIAWAASKYINNTDKIGAMTLFATHYHELTKLEEETAGIINYNVLVEEDEEGVHFLHKIIRGRANQSYGIEVARLAGLPFEVIQNAQNILNKLEETNRNPINLNPIILSQEKKLKKRIQENSLINKKYSLIESILEKDLINITPIEAMNYLFKLQEEARSLMAKEEENNG